MLRKKSLPEFNYDTRIKSNIGDDFKVYKTNGVMTEILWKLKKTPLIQSFNKRQKWKDIFSVKLVFNYNKMHVRR